MNDDNDRTIPGIVLMTAFTLILVTALAVIAWDEGMEAKPMLIMFARLGTIIAAIAWLISFVWCMREPPAVTLTEEWSWLDDSDYMEEADR